MQRSRNEFLEMALELELRGHHDTHRLLTATGMLLRSNLEDLYRRKVKAKLAVATYISSTDVNSMWRSFENTGANWSL